MADLQRGLRAQIRINSTQPKFGNGRVFKRRSSLAVGSSRLACVCSGNQRLKDMPESSVPICISVELTMRLQENVCEWIHYVHIKPTLAKAPNVLSSSRRRVLVQELMWFQSYLKSEAACLSLNALLQPTDRCVAIGRSFDTDNSLRGIEEREGRRKNLKAPRRKTFCSEGLAAYSLPVWDTFVEAAHMVLPSVRVSDAEYSTMHAPSRRLGARAGFLVLLEDGGGNLWIRAQRPLQRQITWPPAPLTCRHIRPPPNTIVRGSGRVVMVSARGKCCFGGLMVLTA
ncbi:hypothetical protein B0H13DRAFT_1869838 [Mycena leptocephala]|nr:hypothetical protein B0H13DRAFT_1869838 [Mycena leptocephala]